ncbi:MAG: prepilin peptidase CpaA [Blastocatellia bacterium]|jgi:prepilin peptidase CpaA|nr:prepilin peptidase CpaA [Blastocatellia bacterium]
MSLLITNIILLSILAVLIAYHDMRYRRIPNAFVLATLTSGLASNAVFGGLQGALGSLKGCGLAFILMFVLHVFGAMGAGDVKLFAAIGSVVGGALVIPTFLVVILTGGALAVCTMIRTGAVRATMHRVLQIFAGLMPGWEMPRFAVPADRRQTIPYGVAIMLGSLISLTIFSA